MRRATTPATQYLDAQTRARLDEIDSKRPVESAIELGTVIVASSQLKFGTTLTGDMLKETKWPVDALPEGAFTSMDELLGDGTRRVIDAMEPGEPVLLAKVTGENGRAGLAGIITEGMRAVTIPVDTVNGVGGFVQPGDRVDIVLTREDAEEEGSVAKIIMENVKVLSVDQETDARSETARVAKSVTLEADTEGAQRLALANNVGRLSLLLRGVGDEQAANAGSLSSSDLDRKKRQSDGFNLFSFAGEKTTTSIKVVQGRETVTVTVPIEKPVTADAVN